MCLTRKSLDFEICINFSFPAVILIIYIGAFLALFLANGIFKWADLFFVIGRTAKLFFVPKCLYSSYLKTNTRLIQNYDLLAGHLSFP